MTVKLKRVIVSPEILFHIMQNNTAWRVAKGIPEDATLKGFTLDPYSNTLNLFISHPSFEDVHVNDVAPIFETEFLRIK